MESTKKSYLCLTNKNTFEILFITIMFLSFGIFIIFFTNDPHGHQADLFFQKTDDFMADFTNVAKYVSEKNPYQNTINGLAEKGYLPISYLIMYPFSQMNDYQLIHGNQEAYTMLGMTIIVCVMCLISAVMFIQLYDMKNGSKPIRFFTVIALFLSGIFLFSLERGNLVFLSVISLVFYLVSYKSENKVIRELALIALALSATLKAYPALFGLLLLYDKKFIPAIRCAIYAVVLAFLPFLFFENGFQNIQYFSHNLSLNSEKYRFQLPYHFGIGQLCSIFTNAQPKVYFPYTEVLEKIFAIISVLIASLLLKKQWKKIALIASVVIMLPANSAFYNGLLFFPVMILFFNDDSHTITDFIYLVLFMVFLNPIQFGEISQYLANFAMLGIWLLLLGEGIFSSTFFLKRKLIRSKNLNTIT